MNIIVPYKRLHNSPPTGSDRGGNNSDRLRYGKTDFLFEAEMPLAISAR